MNAVAANLTIEISIAELRAGDLAALTRGVTTLVRIRHADAAGAGIRVEWDHGPGTKVTVRNMPKGNRVQVLR